MSDPAEVAEPEILNERLERLRQETERYKAKLNFWKFALGTFALGLLTAAIGAGIDWLRLKQAEQETFRLVALQEAKAQQNFLTELLTNALQSEIEARIRFAHYFARVTKDNDERTNWEAYYDDLLSARDSGNACLKETTKSILELQHSNDSGGAAQLAVAKLEQQFCRSGLEAVALPQIPLTQTSTEPALDGPLVHFVTNRELATDDSGASSFTRRLNRQGPFFLRFGSATFAGGGTVQMRLAEARMSDDQTRRILGSEILISEISKIHCDIILYVPGFNSSFETNILRTNMLSNAYTTVLKNWIVFSWPGEGFMTSSINESDLSVLKARTSGTALARSIFRIRNLLRSSDEDSTCADRNLHVFAQSGGVLVLRFAVQDIHQELDGAELDVFGHVLLVGGAEDADAMEAPNKLLPLSQMAKSITLYYNREDFTLSASANDSSPSPYLGSAPVIPEQLPHHISIVDVTDAHFGKGSLMSGGADYYLRNPTVIEDIASVLNDVLPSKSPFGNWFQCTIRRSKRLPMATWIMASETSIRCS